jgi:hypothetical protein
MGAPGSYESSDRLLIEPIDNFYRIIDYLY